MKEKKKNTFQQLWGDYRFNSILVKNFFLILLVLLCVFMGVIWMVSGKMESVIENEVATMSQNSLNQTRERMDTLMDEVVQISGQMSLDEEIMLFLLPDAEGRQDKEATYHAKEQIRKYAGIFDYIDSIYVYSNKSRYVVTSDGGGRVEDFKDLTWYDNLTERIYEPSRMISRLKNGDYPILLSYLQPVRLTQMQFLGGIIVNIDVNRLDEQIAMEESETLLIVDDRENIIFSTNQDYLMKKWTELEYYPLLSREKKGAQIIRKDREMVVNSLPSTEFDWRYISVVPMETYREYRRDFREFYLIMLAVILVLSVFSSVVISVYSYNPVQYILKLLKNPDIYDGGIQPEQGFRQDEIHEITGNIVRNFYSNKQMQKELEDYLNLVDKAQLAALQAQISPHFLFNTLENLRWKVIAICKGENEVSRMILNLSEMLRISLDNTSQIISLAEEIQNAKLYVEILQLRYGDRISVEWEMEDGLDNCRIVKVSLQPLIENAVYHGIKPLRGKGIIKIKASREEDRLRIRVQDNGVGMPEEECRSLNEDLQGNYALKEGHIGVRNVGQRLKLILGEDASLKLQSAPGEGTAVIMDLPLRFMENIRNLQRQEI